MDEVYDEVLVQSEYKKLEEYVSLLELIPINGSSGQEKNQE